MNAADESVLGTPAERADGHLAAKLLAESFRSEPNVLALTIPLLDHLPPSFPS